MDLQSVLTYTTDNWIALLAAAIAGLSALYSRWSAREAKRANRIAIHEFHREFYEAFDELDRRIYHKAPNLDYDDTKAFSTYARLASVYLPERLAKQTLRFYDTYEELIECNENIRQKMEQRRTLNIRTDFVREKLPDHEYHLQLAELEDSIWNAEKLRDSLAKRLRTEANELDVKLIENMRISE